MQLEAVRSRLSAAKLAQETASAAITSGEGELERTKPLLEAAETESKEKKQTKK